MKEVVNELKVYSTLLQFSINESAEENPNTIAKYFNEYFVGIGPRLAEEIPSTSVDPAANIDPIRDSIFLEPSDETEISSIIRGLKDSSPGWDDISSKVCRSSIASFFYVTLDTCL